MKSPRIETYNLKNRNGNHIRKATKAVWDDGREIKFLDYIPSKTDAANQAIALRILQDEPQTSRFYRDDYFSA